MTKTYRIVTRVGYVIAALIIIFAFLVSVGRLLTPYLNEHLPNFEVWSSKLLKVPIKIRHVEITWNAYEPEIAFQGVTVLDQKTQQSRFTIQEIKVNINILRSLRAWSPINESVKIRGVHLTVIQPLKGLPLVEELKDLSVVDNSTEMPSHMADLIAWIFSQPSLLLRDVDIIYKDIKEETALKTSSDKASSAPKSSVKSITIRRLILKNNNNQHELFGDGLLLQATPMRLQTHLEWVGDFFDVEHLSAKMYLLVEGLSLTQWLSSYTWNKLKIAEGIGSAKIWATWDNNQFNHIQTQVQFYNLILHSDLTNKDLAVSRFSGHLGWRRQGNQEVYAGNDILLDLPAHLWPTTSFQMQFSSDNQGFKKLNRVQMAYLDIADLQKLGMTSGLLSDDVAKTLTQINPRGEIYNLTLLVPKGSFEDFNSVGLGMKFKHLSVNPWQTYPGLTRVSGIITWDGRQGSLVLDSPNSGVDYPRFFNKMFRFDQLSTSIQWQKALDGTWAILLKNLQVSNQDVNAQVRMSLSIPPNDSSMINLTGTFLLKNAANISHYLPMKTYEPDLATWLSRAFLQGQVDSGKVILQGKLTDFPFENGNGTFLISGNLKDVDLQFNPKWPIIEKINGGLIFSGSSMTAELNTGKMLGVDLSPIRAHIPYLGSKNPQILNVQGFIHTDIAQAMRIIQNSPLQHTLGKNLGELNPQGPMELKLALVIPLKHPETLTLNGDLNIRDSVLNISLGNLIVDQLTGHLHFTESDAEGKKILGRILNAPAIIDVTTIHENDKTSYVKANIQSTLDVDTLQNWLKISVSPYAKGSTAYEAEVQLRSHPEPASTEIILKTNLQGVQLDLPAELEKKAEIARDFVTQISIKPNKPLQIKAHYDKLLSAALNFEKKTQGLQFYNGELRLGEGEASFPTEKGLLITAQFKKLDWGMLQPYFNTSSKNNTNPKKPNAGSSFETHLGTGILRAIHVNADVFNLFGQRLNNSHVQILRANKLWTIKVDSNQVIGQITAYETFKEIQAKFQRFYVVPSNEHLTEIVNPHSIPALTLEAKDVQYNNFKLGSVSINTVPSSDGMQITQLQIMAGPTRINAKGSWQVSGKNDMSYLEGKLDTANINQTLEQWGVGTSSLLGSTAAIQFNLAWPSAPYTPALKDMTGEVSVVMGHGRIVNLSESTEAKIGLGRMLSIFSLQSIPRRLSLDFSDLFQNGYSFDSIKGTFKLRDGSAYTNDLHFEGPVASLNLAGRIGFLAKDFGLNLGVTTYVTSSLLPAAVGWLGGPIAGVATLVVSAAMSQASSKTATYQYSITGPWSNPQWRQIGATRVNVPPTRH